jgi:hypothetical protein
MHQEVEVGEIANHLLHCDGLVSCTASYMPASLEIKGVKVLLAI